MNERASCCGRERRTTTKLLLATPKWNRKGHIDCVISCAFQTPSELRASSHSWHSIIYRFTLHNSIEVIDWTMLISTFEQAIKFLFWVIAITHSSLQQFDGLIGLHERSSYRQFVFTIEIDWNRPFKSHLACFCHGFQFHFIQYSIATHFVCY